MAGAAGHNQGLRQHRLAIHRELERPFAEIYGFHRAPKTDLCTKALGLLLEFDHQVRPINTLRPAGEILNNAGGGQ